MQGCTLPVTAMIVTLQGQFRCTARVNTHSCRDPQPLADSDRHSHTAPLPCCAAAIAKPSRTPTRQEPSKCPSHAPFAAALPAALGRVCSSTGKKQPDNQHMYDLHHHCSPAEKTLHTVWERQHLFSAQGKQVSSHAPSAAMLPAMRHNTGNISLTHRTAAQERRPLPPCQQQGYTGMGSAVSNQRTH